MKNKYVVLFAINITVIVLNTITMCLNLFAGKYSLALLYFAITFIWYFAGYSNRKDYFEKRKEIKNMKANIFEQQLQAQKKKELHEKFTSF